MYIQKGNYSNRYKAISENKERKQKDRQTGRQGERHKEADKHTDAARQRQFVCLLVA